MPLTKSRLHLLIATALFTLLVSGTQTTSANTPPQPVWAQDTTQLQLTRDIVAIMQENHFRKQDLDDRLSAALLDNYLEMLDPNRQIFLQSDIDEFNLYRNQLDDELSEGKLNAAHVVYQRFYDRYSARLQWILGRIEPLVKQENFTGNDTVEINRKESPWPADMQAADQLWTGYLKNEILGLKLADKPVENISSTLARRFQNQLDRLQKQTSMDNFEIFMNAYTELYDPHTNYMSPKSSENFKISMRLSLEGIGAQLERDDEYTKVSRLVPGGPADKQGELKAGDHIIAVAQGQNSEEWSDVIGWRLDEVVDQIRGKADTWVRLQVKRGDDAIRNIAIRREKVKLEDQAASKKIVEIAGTGPGKSIHIGIITIPSFYFDSDAARNNDPNAKSTTRDVIALLDQLKEENIDGIVVDLRDNGGGFLVEANQLTDLFIDQGPVVQVMDSSNRVDRRNRAINPAYYKGPLLVLVNHLSASASEIFAGAIQDYQRGIIVGEQTFGKGTVQTVIPLYQGQLKITESKFYRVSGDSTQHRGVIPDILYPSLIPYDEIGESALEHALPWDRIQPAPHYIYSDISGTVPTLKNMHDKRMTGNIEFAFLNQQKKWMDEQRQKKTLPLNLDQRKKLKVNDEAAVLEMNNTVRKAKNQPPFKSIKELEENMQQKRDKKDPAEDFLLMESAKILADYIGQKQGMPAAGMANAGSR